MKSKTTIAIALFLMFAMAFSFIALPAANAHDPPWNIPTFAYINAAPNPIGIGQTASIVMWLDKIPDGATMGNDRKFHDYKLTITAPDNTIETKTFAVVSDPTSSQFTQFTPNQIGTYTIKFEFPGQTYTWTDPIPTWFGLLPSDYINDTYLASSATTTLTVQEEPIATIPQYPLPTEYWSRPIEGQNTGWASIASNYLYPKPEAYNLRAVRLQRDGTAPDSAHVLWTKPISFGGVVGGSNTDIEGETFYAGLSYEAKYRSPIIIYDRLYYALPKSNNPTGGAYVCIDLKTGEEIWKQNYAVNPSFAQLEAFNSPNQHGVIPNGYLWAAAPTSMLGYQNDAGEWTAYDPWDGGWLFNITNVPSGPMEYGPNGEMLIYQLDVANKWLALWNDTQVITNGGDYRPVDEVFDSTQRDAYSWNVTIPTLPSDSVIVYNKIGDIILGVANTNDASWAPIFGGSEGGIYGNPAIPYATFWAISLKPESRGSLLWTKNIEAPPGNVTIGVGPVDGGSRVFFLSSKETMQWWGYNLDTGEMLWGPIAENARSFQYYGGTMGDIPQKGFVAYGKLYTAGFGGELFCYDSKTGTLLWKYNNTKTGLEAVWGLYPTFIAAIADGKVYLYTNEHSPDSPMYKGARVRAVNATTGEELWTLLSFAGVGDFGDAGFPIADGIMTYLNAYDMQVYAIGKGPSTTTIEAPKSAVRLGESLVISGSVTDMAAGTEQDEQAARFPNGVPCVSEASQGSWMEYVYMQKPRPANVTGVPVVISVVDSNDNYRTIGEVTSDSDGFYSLNWKPDIEGKYTVYANFAGSESYWPSHAVTAFAVDPSSVTQTPQPAQAPSMADLYFVPGIIGVIVAIIVVGAVLALLLLKKRP